MQRSLQRLGDVVALDRSSAAPLEADFRDPAALARTMRAVQPAVVVDAAGYTDVDRAEAEPDLARRINADAPAAIAREAARSGAWFVHYSSDYVFDGSGVEPWIETSAVGPLNVYGQTKLEGEEAIRASGCRHLIFRASWVHGASERDFAARILELARQREALAVVDDQIGAPTSAELLADLTAQALLAVRDDASLGGTYHAAAAGETSRWNYACRVIERARRHGEALALAPGAIKRVRSEQFPTPARRPLNSRLDTGKLRRMLGIDLPHWQEGVDAQLDRLLAGHVAGALP